MDDGSRLPEIAAQASPELTPWIIAVALLFCAMFFAVTETAFASASRTKIKVAAERGEAGAKRALYVMDNFDMAISTLLICTNIVHIATASLVTVAVTRIWGLSAVSLSTIVTTIVVFFAGEMLPKSIAKKYSERFAKSCSGVLVFFMKLFAPLSKLLTKIGQAAARLTPGDGETSMTEDEIYDIIEDMTEEGILGHRRLAVAWGESCRRLTDLRQKLGKRGKELHKEYKYAGAAFCKALAVLFGDALGEHLTCEKHHYRSDDSAQRNGAEPPYSRDRDGHKRSRGNMYDVGTYQQSADRHVKIVHNIQCSLRAGLTALGGDLYLGARRGGERRLRHGKEHCAEEQRNRDYPGGKFGRRLSRYLWQSTAIIHLGYTTPFVYRINS